MELEEAIKQKNFKSPFEKATVNLIYTNNWLCEIQTSLLKDFGITQQQYNILRILRGQLPNAATVKLLRERMLDKMSDASRLVEKLRHKGMVSRSACTADRRNVDVKITQKGLELLANIDSEWPKFEKKMFGKLTEKDAKMLSDLLDKMRSV
jgi:DNA-binding MarR family transcriptional regulator